MSSGQVWSEWFTAVGTVGAAAVAVYVGVIRDRQRRPDLDLIFESSEQDRIVLSVDPRDPPDVAYVRLRVVAKPRRFAAEGVEVMVSRVRRLSVQSNSSPVSDEAAKIEGMLLLWSNTETWTKTGAETGQTRLNVIPPGAQRHVDLLQVRRADTSEGDCPVAIEIRPSPADRRNQIRAGTFEIELAVTAANADARRFRVEVDYDGAWGSAKYDIWKHLEVTPPIRLK